MKRIYVFKHLLLSMLFAAGTAAAPVYAEVNFNITIAPPAPRYEVVPAMAPGYVWAPGYWGWNGDRHVWIRGRSIVQRAGYRWEPDRWEQREHAYYRHPGRWERDPGDKHPDKGWGNEKHGKGKGGKHDD